MIGILCVTIVASQVALGIEPGTSCMRGRCSENRAIGADVIQVALGCIYATCACWSIVADTP